MFNWLFHRTPKYVKVLVVVDSETHNPIDYWNKIDVSLTTEIRAALDTLAIPFDAGTVEDIRQALEIEGRYWLKTDDNEYGFDILTIEL